MNESLHNPPIDINPAALLKYFVSHLNRIYCAKSQLIDKLPLISSRSENADLKQALEETIALVHKQLARLKDIYILIHSQYQSESCVGLVGFLDEAFQSIGPPLDEPALRDLSILFYMANIESIEMTSYSAMMRVADRMAQPHVSQLLEDCYTEARESFALFQNLSKRYL